MAEKKAATEGSPRGKGNKTIIFLVVGILLGVVIAFGATKMLMGKSKPGAGDNKSQEKTLPEHTVELDEFIVNLADGAHYAKVTIALGLGKPLGGEGGKLEPKVLAPIRDTVITVLSSKSMGQLVSREGKEKLKSELKDKLNELLGKDMVKQVYFTSLTLQ